MRFLSFWYWQQRDFPQGGGPLLSDGLPCLSASVPVEGCLKSVCFCCVVRQLDDTFLLKQGVSVLSTAVCEEQSCAYAQSREPLV